MMQYTTSSESYSSSMRDSPSKAHGKDDKGYVYKKSGYQYSNSGNNNSSYIDKPLDQNVDQLDALLEDLKTERQITRDRDHLSSPMNYRTIERERADPNGTITKTTRVTKTSRQTGGQHTLDDVEHFSTPDYSTIKSNGYASLQGTIKRDQYQTKEKLYETSKNMPVHVYDSKSKLHESNRTIENTELIPSTTKSTTTHLEKDLHKIALSDDILPVPGTKVTTTVRTYTYEIPAGAPSNIITSRNQLHSNMNYNTIQLNEVNNGAQTYPYPTPTVPQSVEFRTESYSTLNKNNERPIVSDQSYEIRERRETNTIRNNLPHQPHTPQHNLPGGVSKTIVYNVNTTENVHMMPEPNNYPSSPAHSPHSPQHRNLPAEPTTNRYLYKESSNTVNTVRGPYIPTESNLPNVQKGLPQSPNKPSPSGHVPDIGYPHHGSPNTHIYKYSSSTMNSVRGPNYRTPSPTMQISPFPVDGVDYPVKNGNPPQRVDDLMQSFGNADNADRSEYNTSYRKREVETAVATPNVPSINKAGKEVYYPPGHETMMTKREEMAAGSAGGGRWAKGSGMYEYESGYKSKTKTKSGGAMVPVCLPLCCAMPCTIM